MISEEEEEKNHKKMRRNCSRASGSPRPNSIRHGDRKKSENEILSFKNFWKVYLFFLVLFQLENKKKTYCSDGHLVGYVM